MKPPRFGRASLGLFGCVCLVTLLSATDPAPSSPPEEEPYELPKMEVKSSIVCSFGIGIVATRNRETQAITHVFVSHVTPDSDAERYGLARGDEILAINGKRIPAMKGGVGRGSDLFELLVNQPPGRKIDIEVAVRVVKRVTLSATMY